MDSNQCERKATEIYHQRHESKITFGWDHIFVYHEYQARNDGIWLAQLTWVSQFMLVPENRQNWKQNKQELVLHTAVNIILLVAKNL